MKRCILIALTAMLCCTGVPDSAGAQYQTEIVNLSSKGRLQISDVYVNMAAVALYDKFEITFELSGTWDNPFDPDQIAVEAHFQSPSGEDIVVPGFFYQDYKRTVREGEDSYSVVGDPVWKIRFAPTEVGLYIYTITAQSAGHTVRTESQTLEGTARTNHHGYVRVSKTNPRYFEHDDGTSFFAVGMDMAWRPLVELDQVYTDFARAGGTLNRLFLSGRQISVEERINYAGPRPDKGLGKMNLDDAWRVDYLLELGEKLGIVHQLCLANQNIYHTPDWQSNVYNRENGGILDAPEEIFTNAQAIQYFKRRLRYTVARWSYSSSVFSWQLWNEVNHTNKFNPGIVAQWHREMARYLQGIDPVRHIIHTGLSNLNGFREIDALPEMEVVSTNTYGLRDLAFWSYQWTQRHVAQYAKPYLLTEFGPGHGRGEYDVKDPDRMMIHNGFWGALMGGSAGTGMPWEWDFWVDHEKFYNSVRAVSRFVDDVPFSQRTWRPITAGDLRFGDESRPAEYYDTFIDAIIQNYHFPEEARWHSVFTVGPDGRVDRPDLLCSILADTTGMRYSAAATRGFKTAAIALQVDFPADGVCTIYASRVGSPDDSTELTVTIDDAIALQQVFPSGNFQQTSVRVPKGRHVLRFTNSGRGVIHVAWELQKYVRKNGPNLEVRGLQTDDYILLWLRHPQFTWFHKKMGITPEEQPEGELLLENVPDGTWLVEWIDTTDGEFVQRGVATTDSGRLKLRTPQTATSIAARIHRIAD